MISMLIYNSSYAQKTEKRDSDIQTLINRDQNMTHGGYAGFEYGYTPIAGRGALLTGFHAAWVIDHAIELGINTKAFVTNPLPDLLLDNRNYIYTGGYGGLHIAATLFGHKPINISFPILLGGGAISYIQTGNSSFYDDFYPESNYAFFVIEPGVDLQLNITRCFRISAGISYRHTSDIYLLYSYTSAEPIASPSILRGLNASIKFKLGKF